MVPSAVRCSSAGNVDSVRHRGRLMPQLGEAEIQQLRARRREHDVARFEIAVDDALPVRAVQRIGHFHRNPQGLVRRQCASPQPIGKRSPSMYSMTM